ncbi:signal transduction histidine kinase [Kribbella aluminosa]|uniref:histidine kinase n=1 Tax=Kribbella aluminosa TaxID=416017 RepID=A0ABS4UW25_9ACTN|nr:sensor histidine kinase [Kribbella aluminosa]MBP2355832.1 signal transduction histidine kinase [Kribbella aluminosa]
MAFQLTRMRPLQLAVLEWIPAGLYGVLAWALAHRGPMAPALVGSAAAAVALALVSLRPAWSLGCGLVPLALSPFEPSLGFVAVPLVCLAVFRLSDRRRSLVAVVVAEAGVVATALPDFRRSGGIVPFGAMVLGAWIVGRMAARYRRQSEELARQQERMRIARELHDIVAHSMGVITVQAGYGSLVIDEQPAAARAALATIEQTGRQTLAELRGLVGVLRSDEQLELAPTPGLAQLDELVTQTAKAGVRVNLTVTGSSAGIPAGIGLSAYRIVQEALTNVVKHASTPSADATVDCGADALSIEVVDHGAGCPDRPRPGHGLTGLGERVALYGGSLHAEPLPDKGFRVLARIPLGVEAS